MVLASAVGLALGDLPIAQTPVPDYFWSSVVETLTRTLGPLVILAWYLYHDQTVTVPARDKALLDQTRRTAEVLVDQAKAVTSERLAVAEEHRKAVQGLVDEVKAGRGAMLEMVRKCGTHPPATLGTEGK